MLARVDQPLLDGAAPLQLRVNRCHLHVVRRAPTTWATSGFSGWVGSAFARDALTVVPPRSFGYGPRRQLSTCYSLAIGVGEVRRRRLVRRRVVGLRPRGSIHVDFTTEHPTVVDLAVPATPAPADRLSGRELQVLELASLGMTNMQIALRLQLSVHAVKFHLAAIYRKLGVANRSEAAFVFPQPGRHRRDSFA